MSEARILFFFGFFLERRVLRDSIVVSSIPRPQLLTELRAPTAGRRENPPLIG
jgi:hypothetical protein